MGNILITHGVPLEGWTLFQGDEIQYPGEGQAFSKDELLARLPRADAVLACGPLDGEMIRAAGRLKLVVCYGAGYDSIDLEEATRQGIPVANIPETVTFPTAEIAVALMLNLARRIPALDRAMHGPHSAAAFGMGKEMGTNLQGAKLGVVGIGRIGSQVAEVGRALGMGILYHARSPRPEQEAAAARYRPLAALMAEADFISVHCPLTPATAGLISREMILAMKPTAFLINTSRGAVVDETALLEALAQGHIAGAGLDVFQGEPHINPLFQTLPNVVMTPHVGSNTVQTRREMVRVASLLIRDALEGGKKPPHLLNPQTWGEGVAW